ncbi:MAG: aspartate kinase [Candidatus Ancaeobacter aquaticus]|nr:aspartate kinase [Candidatus Ancaeobacter aquaticus]
MLVVQKYGGTSVGSTDKIMNVARRIIKSKKSGNDVIVVVSAMSGQTDKLINMAHDITDDPREREMDMLVSTGEQVSMSLLAMCVHELGDEAISFTGSQVGIVTDSTHTKAKIRRVIGMDKVKAELKKGKIVIVAGFQGVDYKKNITTLGRGGSDTTAVALAAVLKADQCEIYTDVDGVYTTDPRLVKDARKLGVISYDEMLELASLGAKVMHSRSIEMAKKYGVVIHVRSSFNDNLGTLIKEEDALMENIMVRGVALNRNEAKLTILHVPDKPGIAARIFKIISENNINIDMIIQNVSERGFTDISFTVLKTDLRKTYKVLEVLVKKIGARGLSHDEDMVKLSVVGVGMRSHAGIAAAMFEALASKKVNIDMISTSEIKISCVIHRKDAEKAVKAIHDKFGLAKKKMLKEKMVAAKK